MNIQTLLLIAAGTIVLAWLGLGLLLALTTPMGGDEW